MGSMYRSMSFTIILTALSASSRSVAKSAVSMKTALLILLFTLTACTPPASTVAPVRPTMTATATAQVQRPTAICRDGTESFSQTRQGTCSYHQGVREWLR